MKQFVIITNFYQEGLQMLIRFECLNYSINPDRKGVTLRDNRGAKVGMVLVKHGVARVEPAESVESRIANK